LQLQQTRVICYHKRRTRCNLQVYDPYTVCVDAVRSALA
jgi:hypothetical protein